MAEALMLPPPQSTVGYGSNVFDDVEFCVGDFKFHWRCSKVNLTHLCFADDLMIFSHGDTDFISIIKSLWTILVDSLG